VRRDPSDMVRVPTGKGRPVLHQCSANIVVEAPAQAVWDVVSDVTRVGEWSGECRGCQWEPGSTAAVPGARFRGRNRRGGLRWTRLNEVVLADAPTELVWQTVAAGLYPDSVEWRLHISEDGASTRVEESYRIVTLPKVMEWALAVAMPAHRDRSRDLLEDLGRLKHSSNTERRRTEPRPDRSPPSVSSANERPRPENPGSPRLIRARPRIPARPRRRAWLRWR